LIQRIDPQAKLSQGHFEMLSNQFQSTLLISDYDWWQQNEGEILEWMEKCLPRGREHRQGMVIEFDDNQDRVNFLLRWS
jgi:hypothetical protein